MFSRYMRRITSSKDCPVVLSITDTPDALSGATVIQRNNISIKDGNSAAEIYVRAREIYFRARRQRPVRAASIF